MRINEISGEIEELIKFGTKIANDVTTKERKKFSSEYETWYSNLYPCFHFSINLYKSR